MKIRIFNIIKVAEVVNLFLIIVKVIERKWVSKKIYWVILMRLKMINNLVIFSWVISNLYLWHLIKKYLWLKIKIKWMIIIFKLIMKVIWKNKILLL